MGYGVLEALFDLSKTKKEEIDKEILRAGIIAELDAVNLYEQMAAVTFDENIKKDSFRHCQRRKEARGRVSGFIAKTRFGTKKRIKGRRKRSL